MELYNTDQKDYMLLLYIFYTFITMSEWTNYKNKNWRNKIAIKTGKQGIKYLGIKLHTIQYSNLYTAINY